MILNKQNPELNDALLKIGLSDLEAYKASACASRSGYRPVGLVLLNMDSGEITVATSAVRWFSKEEWWHLMHHADHPATDCRWCDCTAGKERLEFNERIHAKGTVK